MKMDLTTPEANRLEQVIEDCANEHTLRYVTNCPICKSVVTKLVQEGKEPQANLWEFEQVEFRCRFKLQLYNSWAFTQSQVESQVNVTHFCSGSTLVIEKVIERTRAIEHIMNFVAGVEVDQAFKDVIVNTIEPLTSRAREDS